MKGLPMPYVDGFIVAVPKKSLDAYVRLAKRSGKVWREHGALDYREWVADDVKVGKRTSFPRSVKLKPGETVVFSWIIYKSRAQRDRVNKVMAAAQGHDGPQDAAVRRQAHDLWRVREPSQSLSRGYAAASLVCSPSMARSMASIRVWVSINLTRDRSALSRSKGAASTFANASRSSAIRSRAFFSVSSRSLMWHRFLAPDSNDCCRI
jgi:uncharacterized protein YbaA (DUF1428 family)